MSHDERIFQGGYCVLEHSADPKERVWVYRDEKYVLPAEAVREYFHKSLKVTFTNLADVLEMLKRSKPA